MKINDKRRNLRLFRDTVHGYEAYALSRTTAWGLIRNKCHEQSLTVPSMNQIIEIDEA